MAGRNLVFVVNSGSSSLKFSIFKSEPSALQLLQGGIVERIGDTANSRLNVTAYRSGREPDKTSEQTAVEDHTHALDTVLGRLTGSFSATLRDEVLLILEHPSQDQVRAVGHRVVHGMHLHRPMLVTDDVIADIKRAAIFAPLHNPANAEGITAAQAVFGQSTPQVAVFDTAFHQTMPQRAYEYALPKALADEHKLRRYGAHGTSYKFLTSKAAQMLGREVRDTNLVACHLGAGASVACIRGGESVDTSMGLTPLEGLVMATRSGDIDPTVPLYLQQHCGLSAADVDKLLNKQSGFQGLCGMTDLRAITTAGTPEAQTALDVFVHRLRKYLGAYLLQLADLTDVAIIFSGGIGENSPLVRGTALQGLERWGIDIDDEKNSKAVGVHADISAEGARVKVLVLKTDEELAIAQQTLEVVNG